MPITLDDAEKVLAQQAAEIKDLKAAIETTKSKDELIKLTQRLDEMTNKFDELHERYGQSTATVDEAHHCFWCA